MKRISGCRFCNIAYGGEMAFRKENTKIAESNKYFAISSVGLWLKDGHWLYLRSTAVQ